MNTRSTLLDYLARYAYQFSPQKPFLLNSGAYSEEYLDCKLALSQPGAMVALGRTLLERLPPGVKAIGGLTMGADALAMSACMASAGSEREIRWFTVRKEPKGHGQKKLIEGAVEPGEGIAVVDDVVTSGKSTIQAIRACREASLVIAHVLVLVDRQQLSGLANIQDEVGPGVKVEPIFTKSEVKERWDELNPTHQPRRATA